MDFIIRNARLAGRPPTVRWTSASSAAASSRSSASLRADAESYDAKGRLACPGLIETHIHLDKSRIIDRCAPQERATLSPVFGVTPVKKTHDGRGRACARGARRSSNASCTAPRACARRSKSTPASACAASTASQALIDEYKWAIDIEICVFPQEGLISYPGTDELLVEGLKRGAKVIGGAPRYDKDGAGPDPAHLRTGARVRRRHRHASRRRPLGGAHGHPSRARADRHIQTRRPRRGRPHGQAVAAAARQDGGDGAKASPTAASRSPCCRRPICS